MTENITFPITHRYTAVASGIGRLGWSGNLMTREYGSLVELGSVICSAELPADPAIPDSEHPCDNCRMCSAVCPVGMVRPKESESVSIAGVVETISHKRPNTSCWIGCTGYEGLSASGKWSNWSPFRLGRPLPDEKTELDALCISLQKADPQMQGGENAFGDYRKTVFDPDWFYYTVCGFCRSVCFPDRESRIENRRIIANSGQAALSLDGNHIPAADDAVEIETPFGVNVMVSEKELSQIKTADDNPPAARFPLDREVIRYLKKRFGY